MHAPPAKIYLAVQLFVSIFTVTHITVIWAAEQPCNARLFQIKATITVPLSVNKLGSIQKFTIYYAILDSPCGRFPFFVSITIDIS